jgi:tRNA pseudouridine55 synthase
VADGPRRGRVDGILVVAKPVGPTSHDVVAIVRRLAGVKRVGHGGTLDPFASGVLPIFLGQATRVVEYHLGDRKAYRATVAFGATSTTDDLEGELTPVHAAATTREAVELVLPRFLGRITQTPPAYSAIKVGGRRAYALARAGQEVQLAAREVEIDRLELIDWDASDPERPLGVIDVTCSAGTYVRALARDIGAAVGSGAYLAALTRTASGPFQLEDAVPLDEVRAAAEEGGPGIASLLRPVDAGLDGFATITLTEAEQAAVARGQHILPATTLPGSSDPLRLLGPGGELVGFGFVRNGRLAPDKVLVAATAGGPPTSAAAVPEPLPPCAGEVDLDAGLVSELDPPRSVDPDPASPDEGLVP